MVFRIIPRIAQYADTVEEILFLPDLIAKPGFISCYSRIGEHGEANMAFFSGHTKPGNTEAMALGLWYIENICKPEDKAVLHRELYTGRK